MHIWVFSGEGAIFPSGVFSSRDRAEAWISGHSLSGTLTAYPLDSGIYEWAIAHGTYDANKEVSPRLIGRFSSAYQEHYHYVDGILEKVPNH